jgi:regulatory protein
MSDSETQDCRAAALRLLSRREHSCKELKQKLLARDFDHHLIDGVVSRLQVDDLLSDERFAESYVRAKMGKGAGPVRLRQELREHEVDDELIERYLHDKNWPQLAIEVRQKRFGKALPQSYEERARQMRFLQYRGFSIEQINGAMK